jgi:hypothetical protein
LFSAGPWLLELYDQLYWTADQLQLSQLSSIIWALGRLQLVAVPLELLERLLTFTRMQLQPLLLQQQQQLGECSSTASTSSTSSRGRVSKKDKATAAVSAQQYQLSKQLFKLLLGLAGLRKQLPRSMLQQAGVGPAWVMAVMQAPDGPLSHVHVPASLHAAAVLRMRLPAGQSTAAATAAQDSGQGTAAAYGEAAETSSLQQQQSYQAVVLARLSDLKPRLSHSGLALGLWGAVGLGCRPDTAWLKTWLSESLQLLPVASAPEINMLLQVCVLLRHAPGEDWMMGMQQRLRQLLLLEVQQQQQQRAQLDSSSSSSSSIRGRGSGAAVGLSGSSMVATLKYLVALQRQRQRQRQQQMSLPEHEQQQQQQQSLQQLLQQMSLHMELLDVAGAASSAAVRQFQEYAAFVMQK